MATQVQAAGAMSPGIAGIPLAALVARLRRRAWVIVVLGLGGAVGAYAFARTLPKSYTASSLVAVSGNSFAIPELQGALRADNMGDPMPIVRTEMQALMSRDLVLAVVRQLHLDRVPEFNSELQPPTMTARLKAWVESFLPRAPGEQAAGDPLPGVVSSVMGGIRIFQDNRSLAIDVGFVSLDPELSAKIANALVDDYMTVRARRQSSANLGANEVMVQRIDEIRGEIAGLQKQIDTMRTGSDMVALRAGSVSQQQLEDLVTAAAKASVERAQLEAVYSRAQSMSAQGAPADLAGVLGSATISALRSQEAAASQKVAELSSRYGDVYPGVVAARADLASARAQLMAETRRIVASMGSQVRVAREHEADLNGQLEGARRSAVASENATAKLKQLQDEVAARQKLYQTMLERAQQTSSTPTDARPPDVYVISTAVAPLGPSGPNMKLAAGLGGIAGGALGCLLSLVGLQRSVRPKSGAGAVLGGLPLAGSLPRALLRRAGAGAMTPPDLVAVRDLVKGLRESGGKVVAVVGSDGETGSQGVAAVALAWAGLVVERGGRVVVVDTSLEPARMVAMRSARVDLVAALSGQEWPDAFDDAHPLVLYAAGAPAPGARPLLSGAMFGNLVAQARETAELVLLLVPDTEGAGPILRQAEAGLVVVPRGRPSARTEAACARVADGVRGPVSVVVAGV